MSQLILQPFCHFAYITTHSPTLPLLYLHHSSFSNPSVASPMWQFILQPFFCFSYVTSSSLNSPGKPPMFLTLKFVKKVFTIFQFMLSCIILTCKQVTLMELYFQAYGHYQEASLHLRHALELKPEFEPALTALKDMESIPDTTIHIYTLLIIICLVRIIVFLC